MYPAEGKWNRDFKVKVSKGGTAAARKLYNRLYGDRENWRPRPECVKALKAALKKITGKELTKPDEFRDWCVEHGEEIARALKKRN